MAKLPDRPKLALFASHGGSNMRTIVSACREGRIVADPVLLISNNRGSGAVAWAEETGLPWRHMTAKTEGSEEALDTAILALLREQGVDLIILAGYMRKLGPLTVAAFKNRILNIHPALLPKHGGQGMYGSRVHEAVLAAGDRESGPTVHLADDEYDQGPILAQARVPVEPDDTVDTLAARVLAEEHRLYPETLRKIVVGEIDLDALPSA